VRSRAEVHVSRAIRPASEGALGWPPTTTVA
jgi:hypothetical protein